MYACNTSLSLEFLKKNGDEFPFSVAQVDKQFQSHWSDWIYYSVGIKYYGVVVSDSIQCMNLNIHHVNWNIMFIFDCGIFKFAY